LSLDIKTLTVVLALGNAVAVLLLFFASRKIPWKYDSLFMAGRAFQCAAWTLIGLRSLVPDLLSLYIGNSLMFCGVTLEGLCLLSLKREIDRKWRIVFGSQLAIMLIVWWLSGPEPGFKFFVSSIVDASLFAIPGQALLLCSLATLSRGAYIAGAGTYNLTVPTLFQVLHFLLRVLVMILGSTGYILIRKEFANETLKAASEEKNLLLKELQHRVKNSLAIISGLAAIEASRNEDPAWTSTSGTWWSISSADIPRVRKRSDWSTGSRTWRWTRRLRWRSASSSTSSPRTR
jgi:hypothetical protein